MKLKHRALTLLLTIAMLLTFMPAMAFASHDVEAKGSITVKEYAGDGLPEVTAEEWRVTNSEDEVTIYRGKATLTVETNLPDSATPTYQWYKGDYVYVEEDDDYYAYFSPIEEADGEIYEATEYGAYACAVYSDDEVSVGRYYVNEFPWYLDCDDDVLCLEDGKATMAVYTDYYGEGSPTYTYEWYEDVNDEWHQIPEATEKRYTATTTGNYRCEVTINVDGKTDVKSIEFTVCDWRITNDEETFYFKYGSTARLTAETSYKGTGIKYQWYQWDEEGWTEIDKATFKSYEPGENVTGNFLCEVTINGLTQSGWYYAEFDTKGYAKVVEYPNATAVYKTCDGRVLEVENGYANFPKKGDEITVTQGSISETYTYLDEEEESDWFSSVDDERLYFDWYSYMIDPNSHKMDADFYSDEITDHARKTITQKYNIKTKLNVTVKTDIKSLRFEPSSINLYSEDVKTTDDDGRVYYDFDRRYHGKDESGYDEFGCWVNGDKLFVAYKDGNSRVFIYNAEEGFVSNDGYDAYPEVENWALKEGNNYVRIWYRGAYCTVKVFLDSPAQRAARAKAAREAAKAAASNINKGTVSAADIKKASDLGATTVTFGASVKKIQKNAFKGTNITTIEVKTKKLKAKSVKGSLKGSKVKTVKVNIGNKKINKQFVKKYKKIFTKKNAGKKAKVK